MQHNSDDMMDEVSVDATLSEVPAAMTVDEVFDEIAEAAMFKLLLEAGWCPSNRCRN